MSEDHKSALYVVMGGLISMPPGEIRDRLLAFIEAQLGVPGMSTAVEKALSLEERSARAHAETLRNDAAARYSKGFTDWRMAGTKRRGPGRPRKQK